MSRKTDITNQIAALQTELAALNRVPDDTFNVGTVLVFASAGNTRHWYIRKTAVNTWMSLTSVPTSGEMLSFISDALESDTGYFEVYELRPQPAPFFASA